MRPGKWKLRFCVIERASQRLSEARKEIAAWGRRLRLWARRGREQTSSDQQRQDDATQQRVFYAANDVCLLVL